MQSAAGNPSSHCIPAILAASVVAFAACEGGRTQQAQGDAPGTLGTECLLNGGCDSGTRCVDNVCVACTPGDEGCTCSSVIDCSFGLECRDGSCQATVIPESVGCYIPCTSGAQVDAETYRQCGADGLMAGCLNGFECVRGACEPLAGNVDETPPGDGCQHPTDCPDFQECVDGRCRSTCDEDSHCPSAQYCFRHSCHLQCNNVDSPCPEGYSCSLQDSQTGFCVAEELTDSSVPSDLVPVIAGTFTVDKKFMRFGAVRNEGTFVITNHSPANLMFKIRKAEHIEYRDGQRAVVRSNALHWMALGQAHDAVVQPDYQIAIGGDGGSVAIRVTQTQNPVLSRWSGNLEIEAAELGRQSVKLEYIDDPSGQWSGQLYFFGNFPHENLDAWLSLKDGNASANELLEGGVDVRNALFQKWLLFSRGTSGLDGLNEWAALLTATQEGTWDVKRFPEMSRYCPNPAEACYLYANDFGFSTYTSDTTKYPVPSGMSSMPFTMNIRLQEDNRLAVNGRVESSMTLQYPGNPAVSMGFADDPASCTRENPSCLVDIARFRVTLDTGGRYFPHADEIDCEAAVYPGAALPFERSTVPSLLPGFVRGTFEQNGQRLLSECRNKTLPYPQDHELFSINGNLAATNPIPDGRARRRILEGIDGVLIDQDTMFILFRETMVDFLGTGTAASSVESYGYLVLKRNALSAGDGSEDDGLYEGVHTASASQPLEGLLNLSCADDIVRRVFPDLGTFDAATAPGAPSGTLSGLAKAIVDGSHPAVDSSAQAIAHYGRSIGPSVHYYCEDTGLIDMGPRIGKGTVACPPGSRVQYFTLNNTTSSDIEDLPCNRNIVTGSVIQRDPITGEPLDSGTCGSTLEQWRTRGERGYSDDILRRCVNPDEVRCDTNRYDLLADALFISPPPSVSVYEPLLVEVDEAFRYRTRFRSRTGATVGFTPTICADGFEGRQYCYDAHAIERIEQRIDCALNLAVNHHDALNTEARGVLSDFLRQNFSYDVLRDHSTGETLYTYFGFEHLNAELLIMLGDDSFTQAFASRFDLAGSQQDGFRGSLFEVDGPDLSGVAGFEMFSLYQATQYYQRALARFYKLAPTIWKTLADPSLPSLATQETAMSYFGRLIRASTQKAESWNAISERYQALGRADLARAVIEREFAATYLESVIFSQILVAVLNAEDKTARDQIKGQIEFAQLSYSRVLRRMTATYSDIRDVRGFMGIPPDYLPFPALNPGDINGFQKLLTNAQRKTATAAVKEVQAIAKARDFDVDEVAFEAELVTLRNTYEDQLASICGTFTGDDDRVYPAVPRYAMMSEKTRMLGDPCGLMGNGQVFDAMLEAERRQLTITSEIRSGDDVVAHIEIERDYVAAYCEEIVELANYEFAVGREIYHLQQVVDAWGITKEVTERVYSFTVSLGNTLKCSVGMATDCPGAVVAATAIAGAQAVSAGIMAAGDLAMVGVRHMMNQKQRALTKWKTLQQCDLAQLTSTATTKKLALSLDSARLNVLQAEYGFAQAIGQLAMLRNSAKRLISSQQEAAQMSINVQAAKNDPNTRIYKNDAVLAAQRTFESAMREAYRATKLYEFYTSQSYGATSDLFLVRMVASGDVSLESYLADLEDAFVEFEETYGQPDLRVSIVSLRDDIFSVPRVDSSGRPMTSAERTKQLREQVLSPARVNANGHIVLPFSVNLGELSPFTRNHKLHRIEAEVVGTHIGDAVGRVYFRQAGTGVVHTLSDDRKYYLLPERMAVINPFFNGFKALDPTIYGNTRLRDRPLVNTRWELILNVRDEEVNRDIDLSSLSDVRLYLYYSDFTRL